MLRVLIFQFPTTSVQLTYYMLLMMRMIKEDFHDELVHNPHEEKLLSLRF